MSLKTQLKISFFVRIPALLVSGIVFTLLMYFGYLAFGLSNTVFVFHVVGSIFLNWLTYNTCTQVARRFLNQHSNK